MKFVALVLSYLIFLIPTQIYASQLSHASIGESLEASNSISDREAKIQKKLQKLVDVEVLYAYEIDERGAFRRTSRSSDKAYFNFSPESKHFFRLEFIAQDSRSPRSFRIAKYELKEGKLKLASFREASNPAGVVKNLFSARKFFKTEVLGMSALAAKGPSQFCYLAVFSALTSLGYIYIFKNKKSKNPLLYFIGASSFFATGLMTWGCLKIKRT